jgi:hypothetical protein
MNPMIGDNRHDDKSEMILTESHLALDPRGDQSGEKSRD